VGGGQCPVEGIHPAFIFSIMGSRRAEVITTYGQGWTQLGELGLALVLSAALGMERELRQKSAGLRTHTLVGMGAALFVLVSKYGFGDVLEPGRVILDPSRIAAQVVSGIGFIGGGLIFVRRDSVHGLTTAAVVWLTAAVGMAAGAGLPILAIAVTAGHFAVVYGLPELGRRLPTSRHRISELRLSYREGYGTLRAVLVECTKRRFSIVEVNVDRTDDALEAEPGEEKAGARVSVSLEIAGRGSLADLAASVSELPGMITVNGDELAED
jgi:putative Mg2+ transporter-C (MgtC) family protein